MAKININYLNIGLVSAVVLVLAFNQFVAMSVDKKINLMESSINAKPSFSDAQINAAAKQLIATGIPEGYGAELGVSYDEVEKSMYTLMQYDDIVETTGRGSKQIQLSSELEQRYIKITNSMGCEFCCGAPSLTTKSGKPACSCTHSGAMRGLAKYLLQNHADYSDEQITKELAKWKVLFFPKQMVMKYLTEKQNGMLQTDIKALEA